MKFTSSFNDLIPFSRYVRPHRRFYVFTFGAMPLQALLALVQPLYYRRLIDDVFNAAHPENKIVLFASIVAILAFIRILSTGLGMISSVFSTKVTTSATNALEHDILKKLHALPMAYHDRHAPGEIFPRLYNDPAQIMMFYLGFLPQMAASVMRIIIVFIVILTHLWWAGFVALLPVLPMWFISRLNFRYFKNLSDRQFKKHQALYTRVLDMLHGIRIVKVFGKSDSEMSRFRAIQTDLRKLQIDASKRSAWMSPLISNIGQLGGLIVFLAGAARLMQLFRFDTGNFTLGTLFMVLSYVWQLSGPITYFANYSSEFGAIRASAGRVLELLDEPEHTTTTNSEPFVDTGNAVDFQNVTFSYIPGKPVLKDVSFSISPGENVGLVGPSGSGKTTILNLVCSFYTPDSGHVVVNTCSPVQPVDTPSNKLSIALQAGDLFRGTIRENIAYGRTNLSESEMYEVLEIVEAREFVSDLPNGVETVVGEGSKMLSSGQMQRLSLARAIASDAGIIVLDEATSWVDLWTEQRIFNRLLKKLKDRTLICISHRLHLMQLMDRVLVLREGKLDNQGSHKHLIKNDTFYASSWELRDCDGNTQPLQKDRKL